MKGDKEESRIILTMEGLKGRKEAKCFLKKIKVEGRCPHFSHLLASNLSTGRGLSSIS